MAITFTFAAGEAIEAGDVNTNFDDAFDQATGITSEDLADDAGLISSQLTDRFHLMCIPIVVAPYLGPAGTAEAHTLPLEDDSPGTEIADFELVIPTGKLAYLLAVEVQLLATVNTASNYPTWWVSYQNSVLGGSNPTTVSAAGIYYLVNPDLSPLASVADNGSIQIGVGCINEVGTAPTWSGVTFFLWLAVELFAVP